MTDAWERTQALAEKHAQAGGIFVRLANHGDKVVGAFCGDPLAREVIWTGTRYEAYDADRADHADKRPSLRVMVNFYVPSENKMKIVEGGAQWFRDLAKVRGKYGLSKWLFEIERHGEAGNTKTRYTILPEEKIDDAMRARIAAAELHDLATIGSGDKDDEEGEGQARAAAKAPPAKSETKAAAAATISSSSSAPIDTAIARELVELLKALPRADVDVFLQTFGATRVRDLKTSDEPAARQLIAELAQKHAPEVDDDSVDPFQ